MPARSDNGLWEGYTLVLSLCDGIGTIGQALLREGCDHFEVFAVERNPVARRVARHRLGARCRTLNGKHDVEDLTLEDMRGLWRYAAAKGCRRVLFAATWPCQDMSVANRNGKGFNGHKSRLYHK